MNQSVNKYQVVAPTTKEPKLDYHLRLMVDGLAATLANYTVNGTLGKGD